MLLKEENYLNLIKQFFQKCIARSGVKGSILQVKIRTVNFFMNTVESMKRTL
jgi:ribosomal protein S28E/S33